MHEKFIYSFEKYLSIMSVNELNAAMDFRTVARVSARLECPGSCAIDKRFLSDVEECRLATLTCIAEFSVHGEPLDSMEMHLLLARHGPLVFPYCNLAMYHAQTQIITGM